MSAFPPFALEQVTVSCRKPCPPYGRYAVCLACLYRDGRFELLSGAWESMLGFTPGELDGRRFASLVARGRSGRAVLRRIVDEREPDPLHLELRCKNGASLPLAVYRRFDAYDGSVFIAGTPENGFMAPPSRAPRDRAPP